MNTPIIEISGVGPQTAETLSQNGYKSAEELALASEKDLLKIKGFGPVRAGNIIKAASELVQEISANPTTQQSVETSTPPKKKKKSKKKSALEKETKKKSKKKSRKDKKKKGKGNKKKDSAKKKK